MSQDSPRIDKRREAARLAYQDVMGSDDRTEAHFLKRFRENAKRFGLSVYHVQLCLPIATKSFAHWQSRNLTHVSRDATGEPDDTDFDLL